MEVTAVIEMLSGTREKYFYDPATKKMVLHRVLKSPLPEPFNYGAILNTKSGDGDMLDVFVFSSRKLTLGELLSIRPVGMMEMEDENGVDNKIIAIDLSDPNYASKKSIFEIDEAVRNQLHQIVARNKDNEKDKWVKVFGFKDVDAALKEIENSKVA